MKTKETELFLKAIFDAADHVCYSNTPYGTEVFSAFPPRVAEFVTLNDMLPGTTRADSNVATFRNFLFESDRSDLSLDDQFAEIEALHLPWTTCVFSGKKSLHFIMSLQSPLPDKAAYDTLAAELFVAINGDLPKEARLVDPSVKNASRFTRLAGMLRENTAQEQQLVEVRRRVTDAEVESFLIRHSSKVQALHRQREKARQAELALLNHENPETLRGRLTMRTRDFIRKGVDHGRNKELYIAACDFKNNNYPIEAAFSNLTKISLEISLTHAEIHKTITSAYRRAPIAPRGLDET